jgi:hypothetical protein
MLGKSGRVRAPVGTGRAFGRAGGGAGGPGGGFAPGTFLRSLKLCLVIKSAKVLLLHLKISAMEARLWPF